MRKINIRSCLSLVLVLCMLLSMSTTVLAAAACPVEEAVTKAVEYCSNAQQIVKIVEDEAINHTLYGKIIANKEVREDFREDAVVAIVGVLGDYEDLITKIGFDPAKDKEVIANELFDVACLYADTKSKSDVATARKVSEIRLISFVLVKVERYSESDAQATAEFYYEINEVYNPNNKTAALDKAAEKYDHNYATKKVTEPTCSEKGYTTHSCSCGDSYIDSEVAALEHNWKDATCTAPKTCSACGAIEGTTKEHTWKDATCTAPKTCSACGATEGSEKGHSWDDGVVTKDPTETETGVKTYTCGSCGTTKTETIATVHTCSFSDATCTTPKTCSKCSKTEGTALGHKLVEKVDAKYLKSAADCKNAAVYYKSCERCGEKSAETFTSGNPADHSWKDATCTEPKTCAACGATEGSALGHKLVEKVDAKYLKSAADCKNAAVYYKSCERCGEKSAETFTSGNPADHSWKDATCTAPKTCSVCGATEGKAKDHTYKDTVTAPTCTEKGYTTHTCSVCGDSYKDTEVDALDHTWDEGVVTREPTENRTGTKKYTCTVCKATKNETLPKLDHEHSYTEKVTEPTCTEKGYTTYTCSCGDSYTDNEVAAKGHSYTDKVTAPTCTEKGYTTHTCSVCGNSYQDTEKAALGHNEVTDKGYAATCTEDGLTDGTHCDRCNTVLTEQKVIPATGHKYQNGVCSGCGQAEPVIKVDAPQILSCYSKQQTSVKVTWSLVEDADGYELYRTTNPNRNDGNNSWELVKTITDGKTDRYTNQGLKEGTTYYYRVRAYVVNEDGSKVYSDYSATSYMPAAVIWDSPYSNATTRIRLRWEETTGAHGYQIWKLNEDATWSIVKTLGDKGNTLTNNQGATTAYSNTGLTAGESCTYKMRAFMITEDGRKVFGAYSDEVTVAVMPEAPVAVGTSVKAGSAKLSWEEVNGAAGYQIWMLNDGQWSIIKSATDGSTVYTKYDLQSGAEYQFKIRAYTELNGKKTFGDFSEVVTVTVK